MKKYNYFVAVIQNDNSVSYVTKVDNSTKQAWWAKGEQALEMSKSAAESLLFGLTVNGFRAMVCQAPSFVELRNI